MSRADEPLNADEISEVRSRVARCRAARKKPGRYTEFDSRILATIDLLTSRLDAATRERDELLVADALKASELRRSDPELRESVRRWEEIAGKALASNIELTAERDAATRRADEVERASLETRAAFDAMTEAEKAMFPLNVQPDGRPRVRLAHIEAGEDASAGQGTAVVSVPSKYERLAWFMACAANEARAALARIDAGKESK